jgi:hypothetical protein
LNARPDDGVLAAMRTTSIGAAFLHRCVPGFGCGGRGCLWDSCDSGSGALVYCDCPAGAELRAKDVAEAEERRQAAVQAISHLDIWPPAAGSGSF